MRCAYTDGEAFQHKDTRVLSEPRYELRKRTYSQQQKNSMLLFIHKFEKLSIHEMTEEDPSKTLKESVGPKGLSFPPLSIIFRSKDGLGHMKLNPHP